LFGVKLRFLVTYVTFFDFIDLGRNRGPAEPPGQTMKFAEDPVATPAP
jgi:hypothetical protein